MKCIICGKEIEEEICEDCLAKTEEPCASCQLWTIDEQMELLTEQHDFNRG